MLFKFIVAVFRGIISFGRKVIRRRKFVNETIIDLKDPVGLRRRQETLAMFFIRAPSYLIDPRLEDIADGRLLTDRERQGDLFQGFVQPRRNEGPLEIMRKQGSVYPFAQPVREADFVPVFRPVGKVQRQSRPRQKLVFQTPVFIDIDLRGQRVVDRETGEFFFRRRGVARGD